MGLQAQHAALIRGHEIIRLSDLCRCQEEIVSPVARALYARKAPQHLTKTVQIVNEAPDPRRNDARAQDGAARDLA